MSATHPTWTALGLIHDIGGEELKSFSPKKQEHREKVTDLRGPSGKYPAI